MKNTVLLMFLIFAACEVAACESPQPLSGIVKVSVCLEDGPDCRPASQVLHEYTEAQPDDPAGFSIALQSSPWHLYGPDYRIITIEEVAAIIRSQLEPKHKRIDLFGSWTGGTYTSGMLSHASRLSQALDGFPVTGKDGFLWMDKKGGMRTTKQAFTMREGGGPYSVPAGEEVFVSLAAGWAAGLEDRLGPEDHELMLFAGVGQDVFLLCPDGALADFEAAAKMGNAIAAYNAALILLERNHEGDSDAALKLLERAMQLGDDKASARLTAMRQKTAVPDANEKK